MKIADTWILMNLGGMVAKRITVKEKKGEDLNVISPSGMKER